MIGTCNNGGMLLRIDHPELTTVIDTPLKLGEGPCWSAAENALYFVDILAPKLYRLLSLIHI